MASSLALRSFVSCSVIARPSRAVAAVAATALSPISPNLFLNRYNSSATQSSPSPTLSVRSGPSPPRKRRRKLPYLDFDSEPPSAEEAVNNILYNTPATGPTPITRHTLNCLVSNEPGVLSKISGILAARGFNIESLVVAKTEVPDLSRMTIVLNGQDAEIEQARKQLDDLVPVWAVLDYTHAKVVERELLLVKVWSVPHEHFGEEADSDFEYEALHEHEITQGTHGLSPLLSAGVQRQTISELTRLFSGRVVDVSLDTLVVELCAKPDRIDAFLKLMKPYGIIEAARSGCMAMPRTQISAAYDQSTESIPNDVHVVDATMLPPG